MSVLDHSVAICRYFEEICQIPHGSFEEHRVADYVENFAREKGLKAVRDEMSNLVIYKEASAGKEGQPPLMLQAHMDMVNEKNQDCSHDFSSDPLELYVEDGWLGARGTTLGGDDGYGVAYMMALLADETLVHPPLVCVFTVQEEVGLCGAMGLEPALLKADRLINLDADVEGNVFVSSSGGRDVLITRSMDWLENEDPVYKLELNGLLGGHSGGEIHKERGNANKLTARILFAMLRAGLDVRLTDFTGGLKDNAIPRECSCSFASASPKAALQAVVDQCRKELLEELAFSDSGLRINLTDGGAAETAVSRADTASVVSLMFLAPNGMQAKSMAIEGLTTISLNLGVVRITDGSLALHFSIRSPMVSAREELTWKLELLSKVYGASCQVKNDYPGWNYDEASALRKAFAEYYEKTTGKAIVEEATHGGLETGVFKGYNENLDIISVGPEILDLHTPDERMNLESFERVYQILRGFIETL